MNLRAGLGPYVPRDGGLPPSGLTLHDLGELIRRAGQAAGFVVESEYMVSIPRKSRRSKLDWVWLGRSDPQRVVVAFEIEGRNVNPKSVYGNALKFKHAGALWNVIALYQVNHDRTPKGNPPRGIPPKTWVKRHLKRCRATVCLDSDLIVRGGIERVQEAAKKMSPKVRPAR